MNYNIEHLRQQVLDYYGTATFSGFPMAIIELGKVERMSDYEIVELALKLGIIDEEDM